MAIEASLMRDISTLASDQFGGRLPGTDGARLTLDYITGRYAEIGLVSGTNDPGSPWRAPVPLVSVRAQEGQVAFVNGRRRIVLPPDEAVAMTSRRRNLIEDADLLFVGYQADEVSADDIAGGVVVMLADETLGEDRRKTLEAKSASAVIVVPPNAEPIAQARLRMDREVLSLAGQEERVFGAIVSPEGMRRALGGERWDALVKDATSEDFKPVPLKRKASIEAQTARREFTSYNIIGKLPGARTDAGAVLLMAHWDHLGECAPPDAVDPICNGAVDNASGVAVMLELARRLNASGPHDRDIYFVATSAEEAGLLGAKALVANPPVPLDSIVAAFNFDTVAIAPSGSPVGFIGEGRTALDGIVLEVLAEAKRDLGNRQFAERFVKRQDGWALLREGVPTVLLSSAFASEFVLGSFLESDYHSPSDELDGIELGGAVDDLLLHEELVKRLASTATYPTPRAE